MIKSFFIIALAALTFSCSAPHIYVEPDLISDKVDFSNGKWLLNNIQVPGEAIVEINKYCTTELRECLGGRLYEISAIKHKYLLPNSLNYTPRATELKDMYAATGFDYLIDIKSEQLTKNIGIDSSTGQPPLMSEIKFTVNIFSLERGEKVYSHIVRGHLNYGITPAGGVYSKAGKRVYYPALKQAIKDLKKKSNCK